MKVFLLIMVMVWPDGRIGTQAVPVKDLETCRSQALMYATVTHQEFPEAVFRAACMPLDEFFKDE